MSKLTVRLGTEDILVITKASGGIKISARVIDASNQVVAQISDNELYVNPSNRFKMSRPNWHSLIVIDGHDKDKKRVLDVYFANPNFVNVYGRFFAPGGKPMILGTDYSQIGGNINLTKHVQCIAVAVSEAAQSQSIQFGDVMFVAENQN